MIAAVKFVAITIFKFFPIHFKQLIKNSHSASQNLYQFYSTARMSLKSKPESLQSNNKLYDFCQECSCFHQAYYSNGQLLMYPCETSISQSNLDEKMSSQTNITAHTISHTTVNNQSINSTSSISIKNHLSSASIRPKITKPSETKSIYIRDERNLAKQSQQVYTPRSPKFQTPNKIIDSPSSILSKQSSSKKIVINYQQPINNIRGENNHFQPKPNPEQISFISGKPKPHSNHHTITEFRHHQQIHGIFKPQTLYQKQQPTAFSFYKNQPKPVTHSTFSQSPVIHTLKLPNRSPIKTQSSSPITSSNSPYYQRVIETPQFGSQSRNSLHKDPSISLHKDPSIIVSPKKKLINKDKKQFSIPKITQGRTQRAQSEDQSNSYCFGYIQKQRQTEENKNSYCCGYVHKELQTQKEKIERLREKQMQKNSYCFGYIAKQRQTQTQDSTSRKSSDSTYCFGYIKSYDF